jgi:hypothetical protein
VTPMRIDLDFVAQKRKMSLLGIIVLLVGVGAAYWTFSDYKDAILQAEILEIDLSRYQQSRPENSNLLDPEAASRIRAATRSLSTPWSALLNDLERTSRDSGDEIAILQVAPDLSKHQVLIAAEARSLPAALDYVERLQSASSLRFPMLESHEIQKASREHPVRFEVSAEWSVPL